MAFDGSVIHALSIELQNELCEGRILKIAQPEKDELMLTIKKEGRQKRVLISANPSIPMVYLTEQNKAAPMQAPAFCMLLRKHLTNGRILSVTQPSMERILEFQIEHFNEMGDICQKTLTIELMGKYSNIILRDGDTVLDSIKHVSALVSSVREVLPGRTYFVPFTDDKLNPFKADKATFCKQVFSEGALPVSKAIYTHVTGFSPDLSQEVLYRCDIDADRPASSCSDDEKVLIYKAFSQVVEDFGSFPNIIYENAEPKAFGTFRYELYEDPRYSVKGYDSISLLLYDYYAQKQTYTALRQKTADLRQSVNTLLNKDYKKYDLQLRQLKDTEKKEKFKTYGDILTAYGYSIEAGASSYPTVNFYTGKEITIPLDPTISAIDNGKNYFKKYAKLKRTADALQEIILATKAEIDHLESILVSIDMAQNASDINEIKRELTDAGYKKSAPAPSKGNKKPKKAEKVTASDPLHYISSDGFHMYVGKNNFQNEFLSFKLATGNDWWFHAKDIPGSHVIVKTEGAELPDRTFEEAAALAAHYSKSSGSDKVEVQYTQKKNLKKPPAAKPGFVVFNTYYSMAAGTDISNIELL